MGEYIQEDAAATLNKVLELKPCVRVCRAAAAAPVPLKWCVQRQHWRWGEVTCVLEALRTWCFGTIQTVRRLKNSTCSVYFLCMTCFSNRVARLLFQKAYKAYRGHIEPLQFPPMWVCCGSLAWVETQCDHLWGRQGRSSLCRSSYRLASSSRWGWRTGCCSCSPAEGNTPSLTGAEHNAVQKKRRPGEELGRRSH